MRVMGRGSLIGAGFLITHSMLKYQITKIHAMQIAGAWMVRDGSMACNRIFS